MGVGATQPPIVEQQNTQPYQLLLAAQRRLYANVKRSHNRRLLAVIALSVLTLIIGGLWPEARSVVGGIAALVLGAVVLVAELREQRTTAVAASIQEEFDTGLFQLGWHGFLADHPHQRDISRAALGANYDGLPNWYEPRALSELTRPLDVLVCQRANLDYGVALHRSYAAVLSGGLLAAVGIAIGVAIALEYSGWTLLFGLIAPLTPPAAAVAREIYGHLDSARKKSSAQAKVAELWRRALDDPNSVDDSECRRAQDCILGYRQSNARVPDWFYWNRRPKNEALMLATATDLVEQARLRGHATGGPP